jgi:hypothetical protein
MAILGALNYDPSGGAQWATSTATAMTAFDTTNLRITFTAPASGRVMVRMAAVVTGGVAMPQVVFGALDGATVKGRAHARGFGRTSTATYGSTDIFPVEALFAVTGLTASTSYTWDAAFSCERGQSSSVIQIGGPNDTTAGNAWGGFQYEIYG